MKQIIDDVLYDTDTAEEIYFEESTLRRWYRTTNNRYFIAWANGEILPVEEDTAKLVLGKHDTDKYIAIWGEPQEG